MKKWYIVIDDDESFLVTAQSKPTAIINAINEYWSTHKNYCSPVPLHLIECFDISVEIPPGRKENH